MISNIDLTKDITLKELRNIIQTQMDDEDFNLIKNFKFLDNDGEGTPIAKKIEDSEPTPTIKQILRSPDDKPHIYIRIM